MQKLGKKNTGPKGPLWGRILWAVSWVMQGSLWLILLCIVATYWMREVPYMNAYYNAGLVQGFDALAGVVASADPAWNEVRSLRGHEHGSFFSSMQGETSFNVWLEHDEHPSWNSGYATLKFNNKGQLAWVRRYGAPQGKSIDVMPDPKSGAAIPVVLPVRKSLVTPQPPQRDRLRSGSARRG